MPHGDMEKQPFLDVTCSSKGLSLRGNTVETQSTNQQQKSFLSILKSNGVNFFSIYVFVGVIPFMFAGFKFDKFGFGAPKLIAITAISGLLLFLLYCFFVHLKNCFLRK